MRIWTHQTRLKLSWNYLRTTKQMELGPVIPAGLFFFII
ncbi:hypothetical protein FHS18_006655 [Paenibacillus phyllosphaerae]|uniref:Uncharacterized protein n=1 Tax=Paenibacillus phyllosphaerae TaxID=274593 RepID=A0A7W5B5G3_9BACL|nr:hypothetical protein [Paenibacillus phyllosphaerae]